MDLIELLERDHEVIFHLIEKIQMRGKLFLNQCEEIFEIIKGEIYIHQIIEEKIFYPVLKDIKEVRGLILESYEEHFLINEILQKLGDVSFYSEEWLAKFAVFRELFEHHVDEEENDLFPISRMFIEKEIFQKMAEEVEFLKSEVV